MKILLLSANTSHLDDFKAALAGKNNRHEINCAPLMQLGEMAEILQQSPDLLLVEGMAAGDHNWPLLERLAQAAPQLVIAVLSDNQTPEYLRMAMRAGVREVLVPGSGELPRLVARVEQHLLHAPAHEKGRILAFLPAKGSSGATFLATSLGYSLSNHLGKRVLLIDLNLQVGDAAFFLSDKTPAFTLADVCKEVTRLDASLLAASALQPYPNFSVLASPGDAEKAMQVKPEHLVRILKAAVQHYDFVLLDVDRALDPVSLIALDNADLILPVMQQNLPYLRDSVRLLKAFSSLGYSHDRIRPLVNRYDKREDITLEQIEQSLGTKVYHTVPNSYLNVSSAINQGVPLAKLDEKHPVVLAVNDIAEDLSGVKVSKESWLRRLIKH